MVGTLEMLFGKKAKKAKKATKAKKGAKAKSPVKKVRSAGTIVIRGKERKLYKGKKGGLFYRRKGVKVYIDKKSGKRGHRGDARKKTHRLSPHKKKRDAAKKLVKKGPGRSKKVAMMKYGYGLGQPFLLDMMGPVM